MILKIMLAMFVYDILKALLSLAMDGSEKNNKPKESFQDKLNKKMKEKN